MYNICVGIVLPGGVFGFDGDADGAVSERRPRPAIKTGIKKN